MATKEVEANPNAHTNRIVKIQNDPEKPKRRRYRSTDPDFVAPDGGWGWLIIIACGFSNLSNFPMFQQFGLIFREKLNQLEFTNAQITTVINLNSAFNSCVGLLNGPLYRKFTFRQTAFFGASLVASSLFISRFCTSFWSYLVFYAACYGSGIGITQSANGIALNTYWRKKRRIATGLSWSVTGLGPIVWPYIITALMNLYGMENTLMLFAAFAGHAIVCSLLLQPVHWHTKFRNEDTQDDQKKNLLEEKPILVPNGALTPSLSRSRSKPRSLFSSQYLTNEEDRFANALDILEPGTPMYSGANDGLYSKRSSLASSRISLASIKGTKPISRVTSGQNSLVVSTRTSYVNLLDAKGESGKGKDRSSKDSSKAKETKESTRSEKSSRKRPPESIQEQAEEDCPTEKAPHDLKEEEKHLLQKQLSFTLPDEKEVLQNAAQKLREYKDQMEEKKNVKGGGKNINSEDKNMNIPQIKLEGQAFDDKKNELGKSGQDFNTKKETFLQKIVIFFDLNLLKDPKYLNLMLGITIANFAEINFSILTPFVLQEFNFEAFQIATFMSLLGALDIIVRLVVPFFAEKIDWDNKTFFLIGVLMMAGGRVILVHTQTYSVSIFVAILIGFGKGLRTIFMTLVIPSYVPLDRLPAASGLQLATSGLLFLFLGPVIGWIRDAVNNYVITLHLLNITTYITTIAWLAEPYVTRYYKNKREKKFEKFKRESVC